MDNDLLAYLDRLELLAFFAGYPLIYAVIHFIAGQRPGTLIERQQLVTVLPFAYALVATLYLGMLVRNLWPDYSITTISSVLQNSYLRIWGLLAVLFWLPLFNKRPVFSLLHSLVFFFFVLKDLVLYSFSSGSHIIRNAMKIYTDSLLLNLLAFAVISFLYFLFRRLRKKRK